MSKYNELVKKLKEIFQIDRPELDFGIYRILNSRADEINDYLDNKLKSKIQAALADAGNANKADLEQQLQAAIKAATDAGFEPDQSPKVQALKKQIAETATGASEHENAVFSHLLTFFSRYYDNGDFISKRRYKGDTYAIPYAGEEVMLHWANKDQYYIKSGENFANYSFKLDDGRKVSFKLLAADTAKDNRKDNDADRRFVLIEPHTRTKIDEDGEEFEQAYPPVEVVKSTEMINGESVETEELVIHFEYKAMKKGTKQDALVQTAIATILSDSQVQQHWADLSKRAPTESNPNRTELERHLTTYTQRNTADYFIHKDLGGFLSNELDFYIKNEVMNLDNVQNAEVFANIEKQLRMIQCLRSVAQELITFLAQLENFQKKLWLKKKFVIDTDYLVPIKILPDEIKSKFSAIGQLVIDTSRLSFTEKQQIINSISDIESKTMGLLIKGDNAHALRLLSSRECEYDMIHIDPPYNTETSGFLYKNNFKSSSWLSMMEDRLRQSSKLLKDNGVFCCHIDEHEFENLSILASEIFNQDLGNMVWDKGSPVTGTHGLANQHEYILWRAKSQPVKLKAQKENIEKMLSQAKLLAKNFNDVGELRKEWRLWLKSQNLLSKAELIYDSIDINGEIFRSADMTATDQRTDPKYFIPLIHPVTKKECPVPKFGWRYKPETMNKHLENDAILFGDDHEKIPRRKVFLKDNEASQLPSMLRSGFRGKQELDNLGISFPFAHSSKLYSRLVSSLEDDKYANVLDYFGGSGTTAHAVIGLNAADGGERRFTLIEMGAHFDSTMKPRVSKLMISPEWKNGQPLADSISEKIVKVVSLESYEDTINNISMSKRNSDLFDSISSEICDDYLLKYMLEEESKGSILNTDNFRKPFSYEMDIASDSAGATARKTIDLVETFNYLLGLHVKSIESNIERGFVRVEGTLPSGERTLILWRDCDKIGYEKLNDYANRFDLYAKEQTFDVIYINGDHNLPTAFTVDGDEGDVMRSLKLRQIEPEFLSLMFAEEI
ncbi:site-specific DNA-methyltransferase [Vibrio cholerae]